MLMRACIRSSSNWRCRGRFWCQNIMLHPQLSQTILAFKPQRREDDELRWHVVVVSVVVINLNRSSAVLRQDDSVHAEQSPWYE